MNEIFVEADPFNFIKSTRVSGEEGAGIESGTHTVMDLKATDIHVMLGVEDMEEETCMLSLTVEEERELLGIMRKVVERNREEMEVWMENRTGVSL
jgi:YbbR domain-containing protein